MTTKWISLEGADGVGKSSLAHELNGKLPGYNVLERDLICKSLSTSYAEHRLNRLWKDVFAYDHLEPVWEYPNRYWLYELCSFFTLYHHEVILNADRHILTDGWAAKHWGRFLLYDDPKLVAEANLAFSALPWPQTILVLPRCVHHSTARTLKPSERGAFDENFNNFDEYQNRTMEMFSLIEQYLDGRVQFISLDQATSSTVKENIP